MPSTPEKRRRRTIRSFVRRTGRLTPAQERALEELWPLYCVAQGESPLSFESIFSHDAPVVLEIGFGNGDTLVQQALDHPEWNFLGIEVHEPGVGHCLLKAREAGLRNLKLIKYDAIEVLQNQVPPRSIQRINLYFPDPWPKKRHHKRRMIQPDFLRLIHSRLKADGALYVATDWANYAEHIDEVFDDSELFTCRERREHDGGQPLDRPRTKFERRGLRKGHRIYDWCFLKITQSK